MIHCTRSALLLHSSSDLTFDGRFLLRHLAIFGIFPHQVREGHNRSSGCRLQFEDQRRTRPPAMPRNWITWPLLTSTVAGGRVPSILNQLMVMGWSPKATQRISAWSTGRTTCRCGSSWIRGGAASRSFRKTKSIPSIHQWVEAIRNKVNNNELNWFDHWLLLLQRLTFASYRRADGGGNYKNSWKVQQEWKWD